MRRRVRLVPRPRVPRHRSTVGSCRSGGHEIWWTVEAETNEGALRLLLPYVAERTTATPVQEVEIP